MNSLTTRIVSSVKASNRGNGCGRCDIVSGGVVQGELPHLAAACLSTLARPLVLYFRSSLPRQNPQPSQDAHGRIIVPQPLSYRLVGDDNKQLGGGENTYTWIGLTATGVNQNWREIS